MKILWVKAGGLVPPDVGGRIRSYQILRQLAKRHSITLFTFYAEQSGDPHAELKEIFDRVIACPIQVPAARGARELFNFLQHLFSSWPYSVSKYCQPAIRKRLRQLLATESFEVIICDFVVAGGVIPWEFPCPKILFTHNVEAQIWRRHFEIARSPLWKAVSWLEYMRMRRFERRCLLRSQHVLTVSDNDRDEFSTLLNQTNITVVPTGVDTEYFQPSSAEELANTLVFTGAMDWMANDDAILFFVRDIFPRIREQKPGTRLTVVGRQPSAEVRALEADAAIRVTGRVEDIRPFVSEATVYVVPLRIGGGTRLKIFEAMAMGKAVVSTTIGAEGLPVTANRHLLLADQPEDFARQTVSLLRDRVRRHELGMAARRLVETSYSWASVTSSFESVLHRVRQNWAATQPAGSKPLGSAT